MNKNKLLLAVIATMILLGNVGIALAEPALVYFSPANFTLLPGESKDILIVVDPKGNPISGMQANFGFDQTKIRINNFTESNLFNTGGVLRTFFNSGKINNTTGIWVNSFNAIIGRHNTISIGTYGVLNVTAIGPGISNIALDNVKISSPEGTPVVFTATNGSVSVQAPPTPPPTPTPAPTPSNLCSKLDFVAPFGTIDAADRTNLYSAIRAYSKDLKYDLNNDLKVTTADLTAFDTLKLTCTW